MEEKDRPKLLKKLKGKEAVELYSNPHGQWVTVVGVHKAPNDQEIFHVELPDGSLVNGMNIADLLWEAPEIIGPDEEPEVMHPMTISAIAQSDISIDEILEIHKGIADRRVVIQ